MLVCDRSSHQVKGSLQEDPRSDQELVTAINAGDAAAFDVLYWRHRDWVAGLAFRFTRDHDAALDVLQDTFLYFVKKFPGFTLTCQLHSFLYPVVKNLSISTLRKTDRIISLDAMRDNNEVVEPLAEPSGPSNDEELAAALAGLGDDHREVLRLRFVEGFDLREIAEAMETPLGTVKSRLHYALDQLRRNPRVRKHFKD